MVGVHGEDVMNGGCGWREMMNGGCGWRRDDEWWMWIEKR